MRPSQRSPISCYDSDNRAGSLSSSSTRYPHDGGSAHELQSSPSPFPKVNFTDLKKRNNDIVTWLKVGSVNIDMPIVQTTNTML
ncbi:hypothetical protein [Paenibacillus sp. B-A-8]|uniref:hypothetical protein n=1 Tax=Paenibacillus sp. B-A-8 TaxID=3400419 RepID=UPI003B01E751